jgi:iron(III) transport system permease protein
LPQTKLLHSAGAVRRFGLLAVMVWLTGVPMAFVFYGAVHRRSDSGRSEFTLHYLQKIFLSPAYVHPILDTVALALCVCVAATFAGLVLAWATVRMATYGRRAWELGIVVPIFMSPFIGALGWVSLGTPRTGYLNTLLAPLHLAFFDVFSFAGAVAIMALYLTPFSYGLLREPLEKMNPELEEAAEVHGAAWLARVWHVTIPLLWPSLLSSVILMFIFAAEMFSIPGILLVPNGFPVLSYSILNLTTQWPLDYAEAAAVGLLLFLITLIGIVAYRRVVRIQERYVTIGPRAPRAHSTAVPPALRCAGTLLCLIYVVVAVVLPVGALALRSTVQYFTGSVSLGGMSLSAFSILLRDPLVQSSLQHSIAITAVSTVALLVISFAVATAKVRYRDRTAAATEFLASTPIAIPGVLFGVGLLWMYISTPVYATIWIIVLVMLARFPPLLVRMFETALMQIGREVEEAAMISGASEFHVSRLVRLPLLAGTLRSAAIVASTQVFNELTASALLFTGTSSVMPVLIYNYAIAGDYSRASALALIQIVLLVLGMLLLLGLSALWHASGKLGLTPATVRRPISQRQLIEGRSR